ncbi:7TM diverse intracellular signaling domain-containing protein [Oceanisphaera sp. KMM 10153]|uniref:sensor histidine kinase n=1 Tax=Oceanisphaera submarina TaxID=3390193 RepID=UPI003976B0FB
MALVAFFYCHLALAEAAGPLDSRYRIDQIRVTGIAEENRRWAFIRQLPRAEVTLPWSAGFSPRPDFFLLTLTNNSDDGKHLILEVSPAFLEKVTLQPLSDGARVNRKSDAQTSGLAVSSQSSSNDFRYPVFDLSMAERGTHYFLLILDSRSSKALKLSFYPAGDYHQKETKAATGFMFFYGTLGMLALMTLLTGIAIKEKIYLTYSCYVIASTSVHFIAQGWAKSMNISFGPISQLDMMALMMCLTLMAGVELIRITNFQLHYPTLWKWTRGLCWLAAMVSICLLYLGHYALVSASLQLVFLFLMVYITAMAMVMSIKGEKAARLYLVAFLIHNTASILTILRSFGILPVNDITLFSINFTIIIHALFIYLAMTNKIYTLKLNSERLAQIELKLNYEVRFRELQSRFFKLLTHDFRTPISIICNELDSAVSCQPRSMERIRTSAARLEQMIDQYIDTSFHLELTKKDATSTDIGSLLERVVSNFQFTCHEHDIRVASSSPQEWKINGGILEIIIGNLISNVIRHSPGGTRCQVEYWTENDRLYLGVNDNGPAIDNLEKGVGLTLTWEAVESLGGSIGFSSCHKKGNVFTLSFPATMVSE